LQDFSPGGNDVALAFGEELLVAVVARDAKRDHPIADWLETAKKLTFLHGT
jgi:hypothetical protein